ncbi:MAG: type 2 periplasmic-binding domain-containing protein, partial [Clostridia bacterium]
KAIAAFTELTRIDAAYIKAAQYEDSFLQLAREYNLAGVRQYSEGKLEQAGKEFDKALNELESMKACISNYDQKQYFQFKTVYMENKNRMLEKVDKIEEYLKLADECNKIGVEYFNQGSFGKAKLEFENAVKYLKDIRILVPNYSAIGYYGLMQIYEGNLKRTENKL